MRNHTPLSHLRSETLMAGNLVSLAVEGAMTGNLESFYRRMRVKYSDWDALMAAADAKESEARVTAAFDKYERIAQAERNDK